MRETDVSTEQPQTEEKARVPAPDEQPGWSCRGEIAPPARSAPAHCLIWHVRGRSRFVELARGRRCRHGVLMLTVVDEHVDAPPRIAFSIARSVGSAPVRNRIRRRLRHLVRDEARLLERGRCYLVGVTPEAVDVGFERLRADLTRLLTDTGSAR